MRNAKKIAKRLVSVAGDTPHRYRVNDEMGEGWQGVADRVVSRLQSAGFSAQMEGRELVTDGSRSDVVSAAGHLGETFLSSRT